MIGIEVRLNGRLLCTAGLDDGEVHAEVDVIGWRLEDDSEFVRQVSGINYNTPDKGIEGGLDIGAASLQLALSNGTAGGNEIDRGKQWSAVGSWVKSAWRIGASANFNDADEDDRTMYGVFAGLKTGPVSWLAMPSSRASSQTWLRVPTASVSRSSATPIACSKL